MNSDISVETLKAAPPVGVTAAAAATGWDLNHWVAIGTLVYIVLQIAHLLWKWRRQARDGIVEES
ncbi:hypothetical protein ACL598_16750 [Bordetella bronchialis]|uniref:hypothetical protein n=1 Tax=Bordetella bronchialis TaxID=463025 RepID=UPI003D0024C8